MKDPRYLLYVPRDVAKRVGCTHEGTVFGIPAWLMMDDADPEVFHACPKVPILHLWCAAGAFLLDALSCLLTEDQELVTPLTVRGPL